MNIGNFNMNIKKLTEPLRIDQIDFRIQSINKGGYATILAYKDARADMQRLDDVVGALNWKREHTRDNKNCIVSIYNEDIDEWVSKEDTGTESNTEQEKGLASDSFKRACFNWGIGRELYDYPLIQVKLKSDEYHNDGGRIKPTWNLKIKEWKWESSFLKGKIIYLKASHNGEERFLWGEVLIDEETGGKIKSLIKEVGYDDKEERDLFLWASGKRTSTLLQLHQPEGDKLIKALEKKLKEKNI